MPAIAFQQNGRCEVRAIGGDGQIVGAVAADPGAHQQNYVAMPILEIGKRTNGDGHRDGDGFGKEGDPMFTLQAGAQHGVAYGGNNRSGPIEVATALNGHGGPHGRQDFTVETFIAYDVTGTPATVGARGTDVHTALRSRAPGVSEGSATTLIAHSLRADGFDASEDGTGRGTPLVPVSFDPTARQPEWGFNRPLKTDGPLAVQSGMSVRRLTPVECERLQGLPDNWTNVPYRGKPAADGPRYRAIGNSMAVPVMRWIGQRIAAFTATREDSS